MTDFAAIAAHAAEQFDSAAIRYDRHGRRYRQWTEQRGPDAALVIDGPDGHRLTYLIGGISVEDLA